jgi:hypothetical protein
MTFARGARGLRVRRAAMNIAASEFANKIEAKTIHSRLKEKHLHFG